MTRHLTSRLVGGYNGEMALKRKGSRLIRVGNESYRWTISRSAQAESGCISVIVEAANQPGQRIAVRTPCRDFWLDFDDLRDAPPADFPNAYRPVTPAIVQKIIVAALAAGWLPKQHQKTLAYEWTSDEILVPLDQKQIVNRNPAGERQ